MRTAAKLAESPLDGLFGAIARFVPTAIFTGANPHDRAFRRRVAFCAFIGPTLQRDASCW